MLGDEDKQGVVALAGVVEHLEHGAQLRIHPGHFSEVLAERCACGGVIHQIGRELELLGRIVFRIAFRPRRMRLMRSEPQEERLLTVDAI